MESQVNRQKIILITIIVPLTAMMLFFSGCSWIKKEVEPAETAADASFYHFSDIMVPARLKIDPKKSFVHDASGFKAGTLYFSGRVEVDSLVAFFKDSMIREGWQLKSTFRYPKALLVFEKPKKICIIIIKETMMSTIVEIWVSPLL